MAIPAGEIQDALGGLHVQVERSLTNFWATLDLSNPTAARDALLEFIPALTDTYGLEAAQIAADWYSELRLAQGITGSFRATLGDLVEHELIVRRVRYGAGHLWTPEPELLVPFLRGAVTGWVTTSFGETIAHNTEVDQAAAYWARKPNVDACDFCLMLASRAASPYYSSEYRTGQSALRVSGRGVERGLYTDRLGRQQMRGAGVRTRKQEVGEKFHDDCRCIAVPIWKGMPRSQIQSEYGYDPQALYERYLAGEFDSAIT